jgi:hypothetical protein
MLTGQDFSGCGAIQSGIPTPQDPSTLSTGANPLYPFAGPQDPYPAPDSTGYFPEVNPQLALQQPGAGQTPATSTFNIEFFEEAFEWENIQYLCYPYYWGRKAYWYDRVLQQDPDPTFAEFLRAGAARVVVPVRPGWEQVVIYYLDTGYVWNGGDIPNVVSPTYMDIASEIMAMENGPSIDAPTPVGLPWQYKLPTTQVYLRGDQNLPYWYQDPTTGVWTPGTWAQDVNGNWYQEWTENPTTGIWSQVQLPSTAPSG